MDITNVSSLDKALKSLGFLDMGYSLLKRIAFKPQNFILSRKVQRDENLLTFNFYFQTSTEGNRYCLAYYDAILHKELPVSVINGIDISSLEKEFALINWKEAFDINSSENWDYDDESRIQNELEVEKVFEKISLIETSEQGKVFANNLKFKFWANSNYQELFGTITPIKTKSEISQRFYFSENHPTISADEAYRFLQNKWLEKELKEKHKPTASTGNDTDDNNSNVSSSCSLLRKKHQLHAKKSKKQPVK